MGQYLTRIYRPGFRPVSDTAFQIWRANSEANEVEFMRDENMIYESEFHQKNIGPSQIQGRRKPTLSAGSESVIDSKRM